jgi:hypothetical protein
MVVVGQCLGLRAEEVLALHWSDIDFERLISRVSRAVVHGRIKTVKTESSEDELPVVRKNSSGPASCRKQVSFASRAFETQRSHFPR